MLRRICIPGKYPGDAHAGGLSAIRADTAEMVRMSFEKLNVVMMTNAGQVALLEQEAWSLMNVARAEKRFPQRIFATFQYRIMSFSG